MIKLPFIIPEQDLNLKMGTLLTILDCLSFTKRKKPILTLDKISIYDFLVKHPFVLHEMTKLDQSVPYFLLKDYEKGSIQTKFINKKNLFDYSSTRKTLQILLVYQFVDVLTEKNEIYYVITENGKEFIEEIDTDYLLRIRELCDVIVPITSIAPSKIKLLINPILGV